jgi:hypothetical protein
LNYLRIYESKKGGWVELHPLHGQDELPANTEACRVLADDGFKIELLPSIPEGDTEARKKWLPDVYENKNPDIRINGHLIGDIKTPDKGVWVKKPKISRAIYAAAQQKVEVVILNLYERMYTVQDVKKGIVGALQPARNKSIRFVWIITNQRNLFIINRQMVFDDSIYEVLDHL